MAAMKRYRLAIQADGGMPLDDTAGAVAILGARHHVPHHCHRLALQQIVRLGRHHLATMCGAIPEHDDAISGTEHGSTP